MWMVIRNYDNNSMHTPYKYYHSHAQSNGHHEFLLFESKQQFFYHTSF